MSIVKSHLDVTSGATKDEIQDVLVTPITVSLAQLQDIVKEQLENYIYPLRENVALLTGWRLDASAELEKITSGVEELEIAQSHINDSVDSIANQVASMETLLKEINESALVSVQNSQIIADAMDAMLTRLDSVITANNMIANNSTTTNTYIGYTNSFLSGIQSQLEDIKEYTEKLMNVIEDDRTVDHDIRDLLRDHIEPGVTNISERASDPTKLGVRIWGNDKGTGGLYPCETSENTGTHSLCVFDES